MIGLLLLLAAVPPELHPPADQPVAPFEAEEAPRPLVGFTCTGDDLVTCESPSSGRPVSFALVNRGSPNVNPTGDGVYRAYWFEFQQRDPGSLRLRVYERSRPEGRDSRISMTTYLAFFPRHGLFTAQETDGLVEVHLSTGEPVCFDAHTHEIVGGVLEEEGPIDTDPNRFKRRFAELTYSGSGVVIRSDQRGESPAKAVVWGVQRRAVITYGDLECRVRRAALWEQQAPFALRFTDEEFVEFLHERCGWDVAVVDDEQARSRHTCRPGPGGDG